MGITFDREGDLYAADYGDGSVRLINADGSTKKVVEAGASAVALLITDELLYVSSWGDGTVRSYRMP